MKSQFRVQTGDSVMITFMGPYEWMRDMQMQQQICTKLMVLDQDGSLYATSLTFQDDLYDAAIFNQVIGL